MIFLKTNQNQKQQKNMKIVNSQSKTRILKVNKINNKMKFKILMEKIVIVKKKIKNVKMEKTVIQMVKILMKIKKMVNKI